MRCSKCKLSPWRPMRFNDPAQTMEVCTFTRDPSGFCAWGERRQEEQEEDPEQERSMMDKRTANIFKFAILTLIENGHRFELVNGQKQTDENRSGVAGIGASEYHRKSDTLTLKAKIRSKLNGYAPNITYIDEGIDLTDEKDQEPEQEGDA